MSSHVTRTGPLQPGDLLNGRYRIEHVHESGSMGTIYLATQLSMSRKVAVKVLPPAMRDDPDSADRFETEAHALSRLNHPNVVRSIDYGLDLNRGVPYLVMEYVSGRPLDMLLRQDGALAPPRAVGLLVQVARALTEAHRHGIIHRDLKPSNMVVTELSDGRELVKVLDFGVAQLAETLDGTICDDVVLGTPEYMSPEQAHGGAVDGRSDLYAVGCVLYTMLASKPPFVDPDPMTVLACHLSEPAPPLPLDLEPVDGPMRSLDRLYGALIAKDLDHRPSDAHDVVRQAEAILTDMERQRLMAMPVRGPRPTTDEIRQNVAKETAPGPVANTATRLPSERIVYDERRGFRRQHRRHRGLSWPALITYLVLALSVALLWFVRTPSPIPVSGTIETTGSPYAGETAPDPPIASARIDGLMKGDDGLQLIRLQTDPAGAAVFDGEAQLGFTPLPIPMKPHLPRTFHLLRPGYAPTTVTLESDHGEERVVTLQALSRTAER